MRTPDNVYSVARALRNEYEDFSHYNRSNPLEELLFIICSVQTGESVYRETYRSLHRAYPTFGDLYSATAKDIAEVIYNGGLSNQKARAIKMMLEDIKQYLGVVSLAPLRRSDDQECEEFLLSLSGVGLKVARCVMMFSLSRQVFPVDTHCWRMSRRLGWVRPTHRDGNCYWNDMDRLQNKIPKDVRYSLHVNMISHGRAVCMVRRPCCSTCIISEYCRKVGVKD